MIKAFRVLCAMGFGFITAEFCNEIGLWPTAIMFILFFAYGILNAIDN